MTIKRIVDTTGIRQQIEDFTNETATPCVYCTHNEKEKPEKKMQRHFSECLSLNHDVTLNHDVMREISIPALCPLPGSGEKTWEIDETLLIPTSLGNFYVTGELKIHGKNMSEERKYVEEVKEDIRRMKDVAQLYSDVTMAFALFVTCDEKERDEIYAHANQLGNIVSAKKISVNEDGYYAVLVTITPQERKAPFAFNQHWNERWSYLQKTKQLQDNYFPRKRK